MKRLRGRISLALAAAHILALFAGCSGSNGKKVLKVYNWGDYIDESVIADFEQKYGIDVVYNTFVQNEDMYTTITSTNGESYDVIFPSDYMIERLIDEGLLAELDFANIPNYALINDRFKKLGYDPEGKFSVPYMWGTLGILYNSEKVKNPVDSWSMLWDEKYSQQIFMWDSVRDSIGAALKSLGYSMNTKDGKQLEEAKKALLRQKPLVLAYTEDDIKDKMIAGEGAVCLMYSGDAFTVMDENPSLKYIIPKEGTNYWFDAMCVLKSSTHKKEAEQFINYMCSTEIALKNCEYINYSTPQTEALAALPEEIRKDPARYPSEDVLAKCEVYTDLGEAGKQYANIWNQVIS